jgi:predicted nicotinamide N-methyase
VMVLRIWLLQGGEATEVVRASALEAATVTALASIAAALLGALLGAVATYIVGEMRAARSNRAELDGLMRLLNIETEKTRSE